MDGSGGRGHRWCRRGAHPFHEVTRLLFFGDLSSTGFGTVTLDLGRALIDLGLDVRFVSQNEIDGELPEPFASRTVDTRYLLAQVAMAFEAGDKTGVTGAAEFIPRILKGEGGGDVLMANEQPWGDWAPDAAVLLGDFAQVRMSVWPYREAFSAIPSWHYCPIEGVGLPPRWAETWSFIHPIAMSRFGQTAIAEVMGYVPPLIYHGVDTSDFWPASPSRPITVREEKKLHVIRSKEDAKRFFGRDPRERWALRTDRHMPRKNYNSLFRAMAPVLARDPRRRLVIHCQPVDQGGNLGDAMSKYPPEIRDRFTLTGMGPVPRQVLNILYNAADVYVSVSAEGFGLTVAEALACGTPVVGMDYSAVPEVIGPAGKVVPIAALIDNEYDHFWARVNEAEFGKAVDWMLSHPARARGLGALGPGHVREHFTWAEAARRFRDIVEGVASDVAGKPKAETALASVHLGE